MNITIGILVILISLLFLYICLSFSKSNNNINHHSLDLTIKDLREKYRIMTLDKRINIDICKELDRIGSRRDNQIYRVGNNCEPWISRECVYILDNILPYNGIGLEWSSGSSTLWLSYRLKKLISVESSKEWFKTVKFKIIKNRIHNKTKLLWISEDKISLCRDDIRYISRSSLNYSCYKTYVTSKDIPNIVYDFISIDGRARSGCILRAIEMIKKENGIIIIDNAERKWYRWSYSKIPLTWSWYDFWYTNGLVRMYITHDK